MLASRPSSRPNPGGSLSSEKIGGSDSPHRLPPIGVQRLLYAYFAAALAVVLGLPGLAAGTITANNCRLRDLDCAGQFAYGPVAAALLSAIVLVVLALQFRLGWRFWAVSIIVAGAAALSIDLRWLLIAVVAICPAMAAWVTDPPNRRRGVLRHWLPRWSVLVVVPAGMIIFSAIDGGLSGPALLVGRMFG